MNDNANRKYVKAGVTGVVVVLVGLAGYFVLAHFGAVAGFFDTVGGILAPFVYGAVIAYLLSPLCNRIEGFLRRRFPKFRATGGVAVALSMLVALLIVVMLLALVIPSLVSSIAQIVSALPAQLEAASVWLAEALESQPDLQEQWEEFSADLNATITSWLQTDLATFAQSLLASLSSQITSIATVVYNLFMGVMVSVYLLGSRKKFSRQAHMLLYSVLPQKWADYTLREVRYADRMFNGFLVGRIIDSCIIGFICFVFCVICGFESPMLIAVIVGITNVIPVFGPYLGAIPSALLLLLSNPMHCLVFIVFIIVLQQIDGNLIGPRILGETTGVSSFWVLFSVLFFGGLWGLPGMIVGVPLFAVIYDIARQLVHWGLGKRGRDDLLPKREDRSDGQPDEVS